MPNRAYDHTVVETWPTKVYTGVGSKRTPDDVLDIMREAAEKLQREGWTLRSGHAPGADQAFEEGAGKEAELYLPWPGFERDVEPVAKIIKSDQTKAAYELAARFHPAWATLKTGARHMHARNCHQVLGWELKHRSRFLVCWTPDAQPVGGTATAIHLANFYGVDVTNLAEEPERDRLVSWLSS